MMIALADIYADERFPVAILDVPEVHGSVSTSPVSNDKGHAGLDRYRNQKNNVPF